MARDLLIDPCDLAYVLRRLHLEGVSFVTKTLPAFSKYVLLCCEKQQWLNAPSVGLTNFAVKRNFPLFCRGLFIKAVTGCAISLYRIRQFCEYFYKTCFGFESSDIQRAEEKYVSTDQEYSRERIDWGKVALIRKRMFAIFPSLHALNPDDLFRIVRPHDGPGAFARSELITKRVGLSIWEYKKLPSEQIGTCLEALSPHAGYFKGYPSSPERIKTVSSDYTSDLRFVPKDSRGPRVISKEPLLLLRAQMSAGKAIAQTIQRDTRGSVNFTDQSVNRAIACESSKTREKATVDLKEASDRVWLTVARNLGRWCPVLRYALTLRSTHVRLPSGTKIPLNKVANMGSGICFPILALVVFATSVVALVEDCQYSLNEAIEQVNLFGDDLEIPSACVPAVKKWLVAVGLLVNDDKTYVEGFFRESCGGDYYHGIDVAPVRLRLANAGLDPVKSYRNGSFPVLTDAGINQLDRHCRELQVSGMTHTASYYYKQIEKRLGTLPYLSLNSPFIGRYDPTKIVYGYAGKAYIPQTRKSYSDQLCPYKGLGQSFSSQEGLLLDWCLTPLRRDLKLKRRVPEFCELADIGRSDKLEEIFPCWDDRSFFVATNLVTMSS
jgi:hypothetical protein